MCQGATPENVKMLIDIGTEQRVPVNALFGFIFETMFNEGAVKQIKECKAPMRKSLPLLSE